MKIKKQNEQQMVITSSSWHLIIGIILSFLVLLVILYTTRGQDEVLILSILRVGIIPIIWLLAAILYAFSRVNRVVIDRSKQTISRRESVFWFIPVNRKIHFYYIESINLTKMAEQTWINSGVTESVISVDTGTAQTLIAKSGNHEESKQIYDRIHSFIDVDLQKIRESKKVEMIQAREQALDSYKKRT